MSRGGSARHLGRVADREPQAVAQNRGNPRRLAGGSKVIIEVPFPRVVLARSAAAKDPTRAHDGPGFLGGYAGLGHHRHHLDVSPFFQKLGSIIAEPHHTFRIALRLPSARLSGDQPRPARGINVRPRYMREFLDARAALDGIIFVLRTGCQWNVLPKPFGDDSSVPRTLQRWIAKGVLDRIWARLVELCEELGGVDFQWQSADAAMAKARFGGTRSGRIRRIVRKTG